MPYANSMKSVISKKAATFASLCILVLVILFHFLILTGVVPFDIVWGGRLKDASQMIRFEIISIFINLLMLVVVANSAGMLKLKINQKIIRGGIWIMFVLFLLNTVGNLFSNNHFEKIVFTPITFLLAVFTFRMAIDKE